MGPVIILVVVVLGLVGLANVAMRGRLEAQGHRPGVAPPAAAPEHSFDQSSSTSIRGGSRVGNANATIPLIRLRADEDWIHLSGGPRLFGGPPAVWVERCQMTPVPPTDLRTRGQSSTVVRSRARRQARYMLRT